MSSAMQPIKYVFFGTGPLAESVLSALYRNGYVPSLLVTKPDSRQGRHMVLTEPYIKTWAVMKGIKVLQPEKLDEKAVQDLAGEYDVFIVASYGKIIPEAILNIPKKGVLNVHPSLLPKYRGPSPIESALLSGDLTTGVSIMVLDKEMDHGPLLTQSAFMLRDEVTSSLLEVESGQLGGELLVQVLPHYCEGTLLPKEQNHEEATICKKITKELGQITLGDSIMEVRRKYRALTPWPGLYFFVEHKGPQIRVKVNSLDLTSTKESTEASDYILTVTPEGKKEMDWESFKRGYMH